MKVGLFSPMGTGNLGDASTQDAIIRNLERRIPGVQINGFSLNPDDTQARHGIPSFPITRIRWNRPSPGSRGQSRLNFAIQNNPLVRFLRRALLRVPEELVFSLRAWRHVRSLSMLIFSGSGQLADEWSKVDGHSYSIFRWSLLARIAGIPTVFLSVGAGPLNGRLNRRFVKTALATSMYRSFRDAESRAYMASVGFFRDDPIVPDLAHSLPDVEELRSRRSASRIEVVGISPMAYSAPGLWYAHHSDSYQSYLGKLASFAQWLTEEGKEVVFFPSAVPSDTKVIQDLNHLIGERHGLSVKNDGTSVSTVTDLLAQIADVDLVVASRFHGILLPFVLHKPVLALSYHPKDDSLMASMNQEQYCLSIKEFRLQLLQERFRSLASNADQVREQIVLKEREFRDSLDRQYELIVSYLSGHEKRHRAQ